MKNRELMEQFFLEHQKNRKAIQAIRVVDTRGQVLIKVKELKVIDKNKQHPYLPVASVGSLSEKNFFSELLKLRKGQVWMSNFELGIDNNEFCPPMIRIAAPSSIKDNVIAGFLVINIWGQRIGEIVNNTITKDDGHSFVVERNVFDPERNGIYLHHHDFDICFLNQTGKGSTFFKDYPDAARLMDKNGGVISDPSSGDLIAYVYYSPYRSQEKAGLLLLLQTGTGCLPPLLNKRRLCLQSE